MKRLRILHISTRLILGGSQENTVLSCEGQSRLGHEVHLAFGPIYGPEGSMLDRVARFRAQDGRRITTHEVPSLVREVSPRKDLRCVRDLRALIDRLRPDIVHTHSSKAGILGRFAAWGAQPRPGVVHTIHGPPFMPIEGGAIARAKTALNNTIYEAAEKLAAEACHVIVSVADAMTTQYLARGIGTASQYVTVRSGMDVEPFLRPSPGEDHQAARAQWGLDADDFVIGTVARLAQHKGHDDLLDALAEKLRAHPRWKLLWVGDGWWRERLCAKSRDLGISVRYCPESGLQSESRHDAQLVITGMLPSSRVPMCIRAMDILAHPSSREGLPRTVPQALLSGVCPVAYDADGTGEACIEMRTGRLVPVGDVARLREAIVWCAEHPLERAQLALRGRAMCETTFSTRAMVEGLEQVYERACSMR